MSDSAKPLPKSNTKFYGIAVFLQMERRRLTSDHLPVVLVTDDPDRSIVMVQVYSSATECESGTHVKRTMIFDTLGARVKLWLEENAPDYLGITCEVRHTVI